VQAHGVGDALVEIVDLGGQLHDPAGQQPQRPDRGAGRVVGWVRGQLRVPADAQRGAQTRQRRTHPRVGGHQDGLELVDRLGA
jgi:hypothetical protein